MLTYSGYCRKRKARCIPCTDDYKGRCLSCARLDRQCIAVSVGVMQVLDDSRQESSSTGSSDTEPLTTASRRTPASYTRPKSSVEPTRGEMQISGLSRTSQRSGTDPRPLITPPCRQFQISDPTTEELAHRDTKPSHTAIRSGAPGHPTLCLVEDTGIDFNLSPLAPTICAEQPSHPRFRWSRSQRDTYE